MAKKVLVDTGFWIALLNERDDYHELAQILEEDLEVHALLVPWPTLYECVDTRISRRPDVSIRLKQFVIRPNTHLIDDAPYRETSLHGTLGIPGHTYSLTDHVLRSMMEDVRLSIDAFVGFNPSDFYDVCASRGIEMLYRD